MKRAITFIVLICFAAMPLAAQPPASKEQQELERQRQELKRELEEAQDMLNKNKKTTKENLTTLNIINRKLNIQTNVIDNISREINLMDNNIYRSQKDINKLQRLLDTLKLDYSKSMVYSYKNRSNSDFLNFIFSASSFNDAIKRINYLKSYRNLREKQGENILNTQTQLKSRIEDLSGTKQKKNVVLETQSKEADALQQQQEEKNKIVQRLKAQGKELNNQIAAKRKQMQKVNNAITAAIKRAMEDARKAAVAKAKKEKEANSTTANTSNTKTNIKTTKTTKTTTTTKKQENELLPTDADVTLNSNFKKNKGNLPWPVGNGHILLVFGTNKLGVGVDVVSNGISIGCDIGTPVKAVFDGDVVLVDNYDDLQMVVIKHGEYFTGYSNIKGVTVSKGQTVKVGQQIGKAAANLDGVGAADLQITIGKTDLDPQQWLKRR